MGRQEATALLKYWYLSSATASASASPHRSPHYHHHSRKVGGASGAAGPGVRLAEGNAAAPTAGADGGAAGTASEAVAAEDQRLWRDDAAFLAWVEGGSGAARIAMELKASPGVFFLFVISCDFRSSLPGSWLGVDVAGSLLGCSFLLARGAQAWCVRWRRCATAGAALGQAKAP